MKQLTTFTTISCVWLVVISGTNVSAVLSPFIVQLSMMCSICIMTQNDIMGTILIIQFDDVKVANDGLLHNSSGLGVLLSGML